jgi:hypothetical protein
LRGQTYPRHYEMWIRNRGIERAGLAPPFRENPTIVIRYFTFGKAMVLKFTSGALEGAARNHLRDAGRQGRQGRQGRRDHQGHAQAP